MLYRETENGFEPWYGAAINGIKYPANIEQLWLPGDLAAIGLYAPVYPPVPEGKVVTGESVQRINGVVTYVYTLEDLPPPPTPQEKLDTFLAENPDVIPLIGG